MRRLLILSILSMLVVALSANVAFAQSGDLDCADFDNQEQAQLNLDANPSDPNGLDDDDDGLACESLPSGAAEDGTMMGSGTGNGGATTDDLDCADFDNQEQAQLNLDANPSDPNGLDADNDGIACETLSSGMMEDGTAAAPEDGVSPEQTATPDTDQATPDQYADDSGEMTALPDTGGFSLAGIAAGAGALLIAGGLLLKRRLT